MSCRDSAKITVEVLDTSIGRACSHLVESVQGLMLS